MNLLRASAMLTGLLAVGAMNTAAADPPPATESPMLHHIKGEFDVKLSPQPPESGSSPAIGRMLIDKRFHGPLDATSVGQMLAHSTATAGSAGYVALEQVSGSLEGRTGSFVLQHSGRMERGAPTLTVHVVPDSGTGELKGLAGTMTIVIDGGKHYYEFAYSLTP